METKDRIIEIAFKEFLIKGFSNCSMSDLVRETKLSKGAFYHHFKNKEAIYTSVIDTYFLSYYEQIDWSVSNNKSSKEIEQIIKEFYFQFVPEIMKVTNKGMSSYFIMFFEAYHIYPKFKEKVREIYNSLKDILAIAYRKEKSKNPSIDAIRLIAKYEGLIFWFSIYPEEKIKELIAEI